VALVEAPGIPELYESRRGSHLLIIEPRSGRWWIGSAGRAAEGRNEVTRLARLPDANPEPSSYDAFPSMLVVIKNKDCNLSCTYCFAEADDNRTYPDGSQLADLLERILRSFPQKKFVFLFSGGEPLLHFDSIRSAVDVFTDRLDPRLRQRVSFGLMTNGTPISQSVVDFLKKNAVQVCVSLDGPAEIHDRNRPTLSGRGSLRLLEKKLDLLRRNDVRFSTISTVVKPEDVMPTFEYLRSQGLRKYFLRPLRMQGRQIAVDQARPDTDNPDYQSAMAAEFLRLADTIVAHNRVRDDKVVEGTLANHLTHLITRSNPFMCLRSPCGAGCGAKLGIDWHGNLYPCDTMVEFPGLMLADHSEALRTDNISTLIGGSAVMQALSDRRVDHIALCARCHVQRFCGGGCSATSYETHGDLRSPSDRCDYERALFEGLLWKVFEDPTRAPLLLGRSVGANPPHHSRAMDA